MRCRKIKYFIGNILPYMAIVVFLLGSVYRISKWNSTPIIHQLVLYPAPKDGSSVILQKVTQALSFGKIFNTDRRFWFGAWIFHLGLFLAISGHFIGIPLEGKQFALFGLSHELSQKLSSFLGGMAGIFMLSGLIYLLVRRFINFEIKKMSRPSDYFDLLLLIAVAFTGNYMRFLEPMEYVEAKNFVIGILTFSPNPLPSNLWFVLHFTLAMFLLMYLPFGKLFHFIGYFYTYSITCKKAPTGFINEVDTEEVELSKIRPRHKRGLTYEDYPAFRK